MKREVEKNADIYIHLERLAVEAVEVLYERAET